MSMDAQDVMRRAVCPVCDECVEDYAPGVSSTIVGGVLYHPACAPMASAEYAKAVHDRLTSGTTQTRPANEHPLLSEAEADEMVEQFLLGVPPEVFAAKLETRDLARFESSIDAEVASPVTS